MDESTTRATKMVKRRKGHLLPLETDLLSFAFQRAKTKDPWFHGFAAAGELDVRNGSVYKALARLVGFGLLENEWEPAEIAERERRPRRRLYRITDEGRHATVPARMGARAMGRSVKRRLGEPRT
jgi:PadR family transcriptional regulator PadR